MLTRNKIVSLSRTSPRGENREEGVEKTLLVRVKSNAIKVAKIVKKGSTFVIILSPYMARSKHTRRQKGGRNKT